MFNRDSYVFANHDAIPDAVKNVVIGVLRSWDMSLTDHEYVKCFKPDGVLHLGPEPIRGRKALYEAHDRIIHPQRGPVVNTNHFVDRLFVLPGSSSEKTEVVLMGLHENVLRDGTTIMMDFASWVIMSPSDDEGRELQAEHWRVFQDQSEFVEGLSRLDPLRLPVASEEKPLGAEGVEMPNTLKQRT